MTIEHSENTFELSTDTLLSAAKTLKLLGHPVRLKIIVGLLNHPCCVKEIWECLGLPQAVISQHLAKLKTGSIIEGKRFGVEHHYMVANPMVKIIAEYLTCNNGNNEVV
jgi:ArsR family transcriptional regulator